jgi:hypothetical protein
MKASDIDGASVHFLDPPNLTKRFDISHEASLALESLSAIEKIESEEDLLEWFKTDPDGQEWWSDPAEEIREFLDEYIGHLTWQQMASVFDRIWVISKGQFGS